MTVFYYYVIVHHNQSIHLNAAYKDSKSVITV